MILGFGVLFVMFACVTIGFSAAGVYRLRLKQMKAFYTLLGHIKTQIRYYQTPIHQILSEYQDEVLTYCGFLEGTELSTEQAFLSARKRLYLSSDAEDLLLSFWRGIGSQGVEDTLTFCTYYEEQFAGLLEKDRMTLPKKSRLAGMLGFLCGASALLLCM